MTGFCVLKMLYDLSAQHTVCMLIVMLNLQIDIRKRGKNYRRITDSCRANNLRDTHLSS